MLVMSSTFQSDCRIVGIAFRQLWKGLSQTEFGIEASVIPDIQDCEIGDFAITELDALHPSDAHLRSGRKVFLQNRGKAF